MNWLLLSELLTILITIWAVVSFVVYMLYKTLPLNMADRRWCTLLEIYWRLSFVYPVSFKG